MQRLMPAKYSTLRDGSIATIVYDWIAEALAEEFKNDAPDIIVSKRHLSTRLRIGNQFNTKFNKANRYGRASRNKTYAQARFETQQAEQPVLTNFEYPTNIVIKYHLNPAGTEIERITVSCPISRNEDLWEFPIELPSAVETPTQLSMAQEKTGRTSRITDRKKRRQEPKEEPQQERAQEPETN